MGGRLYPTGGCSDMDLTDEQWVVVCPLKGMSWPPTTHPHDGAHGPTPCYTCGCPVPEKVQTRHTQDVSLSRRAVPAHNNTGTQQFHHGARRVRRRSP